MLKCLSVYPYNIVYLYMSCTRQIFLFVWFCHFMLLPGLILCTSHKPCGYSTRPQLPQLIYKLSNWHFFIRFNVQIQGGWLKHVVQFIVDQFGGQGVSIWRWQSKYVVPSIFMQLEEAAVLAQMMRLAPFVHYHYLLVVTSLLLY